MSDYIEMGRTETDVTVDFYMTNDRVMALMEKLVAVDPDILMSSHDWETLWMYCIKKKDPDILTGMKSVLDMTGFTAIWPLSPENEDRAGRFAALLRSMTEEEEELCRVVREEGGEIEWELKGIR